MSGFFFRRYTVVWCSTRADQPPSVLQIHFFAAPWLQDGSVFQFLRVHVAYLTHNGQHAATCTHIPTSMPCTVIPTSIHDMPCLRCPRQDAEMQTQRHTAHTHTQTQCTIGFLRDPCHLPKYLPKPCRASHRLNRKGPYRSRCSRQGHPPQ